MEAHHTTNSIYKMLFFISFAVLLEIMIILCILIQLGFVIYVFILYIIPSRYA